MLTAKDLLKRKKPIHSVTLEEFHADVFSTRNFC